MRVKATIEVEYDVDPANLSVHENHLYSERYRILSELTAFFESRDVKVEVEPVVGEK